MEVFRLMGSVFIKDDASAELDKVEEKADRADFSIANLGKRITSAGETLSKFGGLLIKGVTIPLTAAGIASFKMASDVNESINKVEVAFKKNADAVIKWSDTTLKRFGIAKGSSLDMAALFGDMATSMGLSTDKASDMSMSLVGLAGDLASFKNIGISEATTALNGIFTGETESLKMIGVVMTQTNLQQFAHSEGIRKNIKDMSQAELTMLRYNYILSVTKNSQDDFARTNQGSANQMRMFIEGAKQLTATLGKNLLPEITPLFQKANDFIVLLNSMDVGTQKSILSFGALAITLGPAALGLGKLTEFTGKFETVLSKIPGNVQKLSSDGISGFQKFGSSAIESFDKISKLTVFEKLNPKIKELGGNFIWMTEKVRYGSNLSPIIDSMGSKASGAFSKISGLIPANVKGIFSKVSKAVGVEIPKLTAVFGDLGGKTFSGLKTIVGIGLKMIAPAALIGVLLLGLGVAQQKMGLQLDNVIANITLKGPQLIQNFTNGLLTKIPSLITTGTTLLMNLINALTANAPSLITAAVAIITSLVNGVTNNIPRLIPVVLKLIQTILISIIDNLPKLVMAGLNLLLSLAQGMSKNTDKIVNTITTILIRLIKVIAQHLPEIISAGIKILVALIQGISEAIPQLIAALPKIFSAIVNGLKKMDWKSIGINIIKGIAEGVAAMATGLAKSVINAAKGALSAVKSFLGIHSPSTKFKDEIGSFIPAGIAAGIDDNGDVVNSSLDDLSKNMKFNTDLQTTLNATANLGSVKTTDKLSGSLVNTNKPVNSTNVDKVNEGNELTEILKVILEWIKIIANTPSEFNIDGKPLWESISPYAALASAGRR